MFSANPQYAKLHGFCRFLLNSLGGNNMPCSKTGSATLCWHAEAALSLPLISFTPPFPQLSQSTLWKAMWPLCECRGGLGSQTRLHFNPTLLCKFWHRCVVIHTILNKNYEGRSRRVPYKQKNLICSIGKFSSLTRKPIGTSVFFPHLCLIRNNHITKKATKTTDS